MPSQALLQSAFDMYYYGCNVSQLNASTSGTTRTLSISCRGAAKCVSVSDQCLVKMGKLHSGITIEFDIFFLPRIWITKVKNFDWWLFNSIIEHCHSPANLLVGRCVLSIDNAIYPRSVKLFLIILSILSIVLCVIVIIGECFCPRPRIVDVTLIKT
mgnify:CR=1 FL=1